jgi:hypothetical protein
VRTQCEYSWWPRVSTKMRRTDDMTYTPSIMKGSKLVHELLGKHTHTNTVQRVHLLLVHITCSSVSSFWLRIGRSSDRGSIPDRGERIFPLVFVSRPVLGPIQPPVQCVPGVLCAGLKCGRGVTLITHPYIMPRSNLIWVRAIPPLPPRAFRACSETTLAF